MKITVNNERYGKIEYEESIWTGSKKLAIGGEQLQKCKKNEFLLKRGEGTSTCVIKGSSSSPFGISLLVEGETIRLADGFKWYEYIFPILMAALVIIWGNSVVLCSIIPIVGGAIGGAIAGVFAVLTLFITSQLKGPALKLLVGGAMLVGTFLVCFLAALLVLMII